MKNSKTIISLIIVSVLMSMVSVLLSSCIKVSDESETSAVDTSNEVDSSDSCSYSDPYELSGYILHSLDEMARGTGLEFENVSGYRNWLDKLSVLETECDIDNDGTCESYCITEIYLSGQSDFTLYGISIGMTRAEVEAIISGNDNIRKENLGYRSTDYTTGLDFYIDMSAIDDYVDSVTLKFENHDVQYDLYSYYEEIYGMELIDAEERIYRCEMFDCYVSELGTITKISYTSELPHLNIAGIRIGMTQEEVMSALEKSDFHAVDDYYIEEYYNDELYIIYDDSGKYVERVELIKGKVLDLGDSFFLDTWNVCENYDCVEIGENYFYGDGIRLHQEASLRYIDEISITKETEYNIWGVEYGMDVDEAIALLAKANFDIQLNVLCDNNEGVYALVKSEDGKTVSGITVGWY